MSVVAKVSMAPNGPQFSQLVQGYWRLGEWGFNAQACHTFIQQHLELGISSVDHAHIYGNPSCEQLFGAALKLDGALREKLQIISKCGIELPKAKAIAHYDSSEAVILASVEQSLARLGTEYLDVLLIHRPDYLMDADEVAAAFTKLHVAGKVKHFGVSNFTVNQFALLQSRLEQPLVTNQIEINPLNTATIESGVLEDLQLRRVLPMAWSCLAGGQIFNAKSEQTRRVAAMLEVIRSELDAASIDQVVFAWVLKMPSCPVPILGSGKMQRVQVAVDALSLSMSREQWYRILAAARGRDVA